MSAKAACRHKLEDSLRVHESRADGVDADGFRREFACEAARHLKHRGFRGVVVRYGVVLCGRGQPARCATRRARQPLLTWNASRPAMLAMRMTLPPVPKRLIWRPAPWMVNNAPFTFVAMTCRECQSPGERTRVHAVPLEDLLLIYRGNAQDSVGSPPQRRRCPDGPPCLQSFPPA